VSDRHFARSSGRHNIDDAAKAKRVECRAVISSEMSPTFGTRLVANGVDIITAQSLMRHSTPNLTLSIYVHKDTQRMAAAVAAMPEIETNHCRV